MTGSRFIYTFEDGDSNDRMLLGGKGANLCAMTQIGLDVPPGFVITTAACLAYLDHQRLPDGLMDDVRRHVAILERKSGKAFGSATDPLLVSVRSGSAMSMPGMMDTILNLGLNAETLQGLAARTGNPRFTWDAYRRFIQLFGKIAMGVPDEAFDAAMASVKRKHGAVHDVDLGADSLQELAQAFLAVYREQTGAPLPADPFEQLELSIRAVFQSWNGKRAVDYRRQFRITPAMANGTAVNVCAMVFGNMGEDSATGVGFTRNPATGENVIYGEYLVNAQGEDVVAGIRTPKPIVAMAQEMPDLYRQLLELRAKLEAHYKEVQDFEFTIERGRLYCLQTRNGKMNARAMVTTSVQMVEEGLIPRGRAPVAHRRADARATARTHARSRARGAAAGAGSSGISRRRLGRHRLRRRHRGAERPGRRERDPRARGDEARRHPRLLRGARDPDLPRRQDLACRRRCARDGQAVRVRLRRDRDRRARAHLEDRRRHHAGARRHHDRRQHGQRLSGKDPDCRGGILPRARDAPDLGRRGRATQGHGQCRHAPRRRARPRVWRDGHRPVPHRAHVQRPAAAADRARDDPGRNAGGAARSARQAPADPARRLQGHPGGDGGAAGDRAPARSADARVPADRLAARVRDRPFAQPSTGRALGVRAAGHVEAPRSGTAARLRREPGQTADEASRSTARRNAATRRSSGARRC